MFDWRDVGARAELPTVRRRWHGQQQRNNAVRPVANSLDSILKGLYQVQACGGLAALEFGVSKKPPTGA